MDHNEKIKNLSDTLINSSYPLNLYKSLLAKQAVLENVANKLIIPSSYIAPLGVQLEITYNCNLNCYHCYNDSSSRKTTPELTPRQWMNLAQEIADMGVFIAIISGGEPLLKQNILFKLMDIMHKSGMYFVLISNGYLMDDDIVKKLLKYEYRYIQISIDGAAPEIHDAIRGVPGSWQRAVQAATKISSAGLPLSVACTVLPENYRHIRDMVELAVTLGAHQLILDSVIYSGRAAAQREKLLPLKSKIKYINQQIKDCRKIYGNTLFIISYMAQAIQLRGKAIGANKIALIRPNGDVKIDCLMPFVFGNITRKPLQQIWQEGLNLGYEHPKVKSMINAIVEDEDLMTAANFPCPNRDNDIYLEEQP